MYGIEWLRNYTICLNHNYLCKDSKWYEFMHSKHFDFEIKYSVDIMVVLVFGILIGVDNTGEPFISLYYFIYLYVLQQVRSFLCARKVSCWMQHISYITYTHRLIFIICSWWEKYRIESIVHALNNSLCIIWSLK